MFTIIGAMAELESSLISERVTAGMKAAAARGKHLGRPPIPRHVVTEIRALAGSTDLSVRSIHKKLAGKVSRGIVGEITKRVRSHQKGPFPSLSALVTGFYTYPQVTRTTLSNSRAGASQHHRLPSSSPCVSASGCGGEP
jgi:Resolvase, N terminal domain